MLSIDVFQHQPLIILLLNTYRHSYCLHFRYNPHPETVASTPFGYNISTCHKNSTAFQPQLVEVRRHQLKLLFMTDGRAGTHVDSRDSTLQCQSLKQSSRFLRRALAGSSSLDLTAGLIISFVTSDSFLMSDACHESF